MKKQPKPLNKELTKEGKPRQRAPGAGRPVAGRSCNLPRVSPEAHGMLIEIKEALGLKSLADSIDYAAKLAQRTLRTSTEMSKF